MVNDDRAMRRRVFLQEQSKNDQVQAADDVVLVVDVVGGDDHAKNRVHIQARCYYVAVAMPQDRFAVESKRWRLQNVSNSQKVLSY